MQILGTLDTVLVQAREEVKRLKEEEGLQRQELEGMIKQSGNAWTERRDLVTRLKTLGPDSIPSCASAPPVWVGRAHAKPLVGAWLSARQCLPCIVVTVSLLAGW